MKVIRSLLGENVGRAFVAHNSLVLLSTTSGVSRPLSLLSFTLAIL